ncbi:AraC family transcriptional regulator [Thermopolyspora sp. NPDC052614]|uniref:AraC family transcriptional regulator n=1 Tax=Thermopolyspora sp. NPDC052614 TaxID=3155682 RepID=UPI0034369FF0
MDRTSRFDMGAYAGFDMAAYVSRTLSSWDDVGWRALLVQRFRHAPSVERLTLPASSDHHLWLVTAGAGRMRIRRAGEWSDVVIRPGHLDLAIPGEPTHLEYAATLPMETVQVHLPAATVDRVKAELGARGPVRRPGDDAVLAQLMRSLAAAAERRVDALYAEAAAEFLAVHLVAGPGGGGVAAATREDARVRKAVAFMRERLAEPIGLADIAAEVHLSTYHFLRVFKAVTGETPRRYLIRLRVEEAKRLLDRGMPVSEVAARCGFSSPAHLSDAFLRTTGLRPSRYRVR